MKMTTKRRVPQRKRRSKFKTLLFLFFLCLLLTLAGFIMIIDRKADPIILDMAEDKAKNVAMQAINDSVSDAIKWDDDGYKDIVDYRFDAEGNIISVSTNVNETNTLEGNVLDGVTKRIDNSARCPIYIPIGTLLGSDLLTGRGPSLVFYISLSGSARSSIENLFESTGINQTRHQIQIKVEADLSIVMANRRTSTSVDNSIVIGETIIVGEIPEKYYGTNKTTNDGER